MITHPRPDELTEAVAAWIEQVRPQLDARNAFLARVAGNALATVTRELRQGPDAEAGAAARLAGVLGRDGSLHDLTAELCDRLASGAMGVDTPGLLAALRANTLDQLAIDQPTYRHDRS